MVFFFTPSSCHVEEVSVVLINFPVGFRSAFFLSSALSTLTGLCKVPFLSSTTGGAGGGGAFSTFEGVLIISRIANASASATALLALIDFNASSAAFSSTTAFEGASGTIATSGVAFTDSLFSETSNFLLASSSASLMACCFFFFSSFAACNSAS